MVIISPKPETIKAYETHDDTDIDITAELLGLWELVVESYDIYDIYDINEARQESTFHCRIHLDYAICPRCRSVSGDIHQYKRRRVRDMMCFGRVVYLVFDIRRFRCPECHKVFTESLDSIAFNQRNTRRFEQMVYQECLSQTFQDVAKKLGMNWHTVERMFYRKACEHFQYSAKQFPQILGVDEISNKKGHKQYLLVISDLQRKYVIEVLPDRLKDTLVNWLYSLPIWEGINNRVKLIKRRAYGYRNVTNFRNRIVAEIHGAGPLAVIPH